MNTENTITGIETTATATEATLEATPEQKAQLEAELLKAKLAEHEAQAKMEASYGVFNGTSKHASKEIYDFLTEQYGVTKAVAHKAAHAYACDFGQAMKRSGEAKVKNKVGATNKKGELNLKETVAMTAKGVESTPSLQLGHAVQWLSEAGKHDVSYGHTTWRLSDRIDKWLNSL